MCVIMVANQGVRPTEEMVRLGWEQNKFGGGVAWQEKGLVHWKKGLTLEEMQEENLRLPFPYVLHFRVPSQNTSVLPGVCHPFPIEGKVSLTLAGSTKVGVLFHNGFWADWKNKLAAYSTASRFRLPGGPWSDTRGLAWVTSHFGMGMLELIDEKVIVMTPKVIHTFGTGWQIEQNVIVSNLIWKKTVTPPYTGHNTNYKDAYWNNRTVHGAQGGGSSQETFRPLTGGLGNTSGPETTAASGQAQQETVQQGETKARIPVEISGRAATQPTALVPLRDRGAVRRDDDPPRGLSEQELFEWARNINKPTASTQPSATVLGGVTYPPNLTMRCHDCKNAIAQVWEHAYRRCWDCWDKYQKGRFEQAMTPNSGVAMLETVCEATCNFCGMNRSIHRTESTNKWICNVCWINHGRLKLKNATYLSVPLEQPTGQVH